MKTEDQKLRRAAMSLKALKNAAADSLEELRLLLIPGAREQYKLTFIARHPDNPELDIVVTEDTGDDLRALVERRLP